VTDRVRDVPLISVVDDDESMRNGTVRLLRSLGFVAQAFPSARAFLNSEQLARTSCLIVDIQMPEMTGLQLQAALGERGNDIPIIFVTAFHDEKARTQALERGAVCFLAKPFDPEALVHCLNIALKV
jgi:FixJ family two-component response regulator